MIPAVVVAQVSKRYGALCALDAVSLDIEQGEFFGHADVPPHLSLAIVVACFLGLTWFALWLLETGYKLRH